MFNQKILITMTTENNKLIAEFMGGKYNKDVNFHIHENEIWLPKWGVCAVNATNKVSQTSTGILTGKILLYSSDWNWLIELVEKIESHGFTFEIKKNWARITRKGENIVLRWEEDRTKIEATYNACVEFIKWYNQQQ